jgi:hypothetical protein
MSPWVYFSTNADSAQYMSGASAPPAASAWSSAGWYRPSVVAMMVVDGVAEVGVQLQVPGEHLGHFVGEGVQVDDALRAFRRRGNAGEHHRQDHRQARHDGPFRRRLKPHILLLSGWNFSVIFGELAHKAGFRPFPWRAVCLSEMPACGRRANGRKTA